MSEHEMVPAGDTLSVIERLASNPDVDVDKIERLLQMREREQNRQAEREFNAAFATMQGELPVMPERGAIKVNDVVRSKYALWEDVNEIIKPILLKNGFGLSFRTKMEGATIAVTGVLSHKAGHSIETTVTLPADTGGSKNAVQAVASSTSYGKRYAAGALLNLTSRGEDDDGIAGGAKCISEAQEARLMEWVETAEADLPKFCAHLHINSLAELPASHYIKALQLLKDKHAKMVAEGKAT